MKTNHESMDAESALRGNLRFYGTLGEAGISARIRELDKEWDGETFLRTAITGAGLFGLAMGIFGSRFWRLLAWAALPVLYLASRGGWGSQQGLLQFLGLRSRAVIQEEKFALKAMRGDFKRVDIPLDAVGEALDRSSSSAMEAVRA